MSTKYNAGIFAAIRAEAVVRVGQCALLVETGAKQLAPVKTGNHRRSIYSEVRQEGNIIKGIVSHHSDYGAYLELGTSKMAARPHFQPALDAAEPEIRRILGGA